MLATTAELFGVLQTTCGRYLGLGCPELAQAGGKRAMQKGKLGDGKEGCVLRPRLTDGEGRDGNPRRHLDDGKQ